MGSGEIGGLICYSSPFASTPEDMATPESWPLCAVIAATAVGQGRLCKLDGNGRTNGANRTKSSTERNANQCQTHSGCGRSRPGRRLAAPTAAPHRSCRPTDCGRPAPNGRAQWESPMEPATPHKSTDGVSMQPAGSTGGGGGDTAARSSTQQHAQQQAASAAALAAASVPACLDALGLDDFERRADPRGGVHHHRVELSKDPPQIAFESLTHSLEVAVAD